MAKAFTFGHLFTALTNICENHPEVKSYIVYKVNSVVMVCVSDHLDYSSMDETSFELITSSYSNAPLNHNGLVSIAEELNNQINTIDFENFYHISLIVMYEGEALGQMEEYAKILNVPVIRDLVFTIPQNSGWLAPEVLVATKGCWNPELQEMFYYWAKDNNYTPKQASRYIANLCDGLPAKQRLLLESYAQLGCASSYYNLRDLGSMRVRPELAEQVRQSTLAAMSVRPIAYSTVGYQGYISDTRYTKAASTMNRGIIEFARLA